MWFCSLVFVCVPVHQTIDLLQWMTWSRGWWMLNWGTRSPSQLFWRWQKVPMQLMQTVCCSEWATLGPCNPEQEQKVHKHFHLHIPASQWLKSRTQLQ
jgi:hypothetical protein